MTEKPMEPARRQEEYHDLIDRLAERKMTGEVTFYFKGGNIESCRVSEIRSKSEIKMFVEKKKNRRQHEKLSGAK